MDYSKIYTQFIADRLTRQPSKPSYVEKHHIVPRALGGTDAPDNIIRLTPEDHYFAHLLLAKIHGGRMWCPLVLMCESGRINRRVYGWVKRAMAIANSGERSHQYDFTLHRLEHKDGRRWEGTQYEMRSLGIEPSLANMLVKGRTKSAKGWHIEGVTRFGKQGGKNHPMYRDTTYEFENIRDGRRFTGTQYEFLTAHRSEVTKTAVCNIVHGNTKMTESGWHLYGAALPRVGRGSQWCKSPLQEAHGLSERV